MSLLESGVFERHPGLKVAFLEAGAAWLPHWLWRLDEICYGPLSGEVAEHIRLKPSEYFKRQCWIGFEPGEPCLRQVIDMVGDWLATRCKELAQRSHPVQSQRTIAACFAEEQPLLRPITAHFDGYVEQMLRVSSTCLDRVDRNRYSVPASAAGHAVSVRTTADQVRVVAHGEVIAAHPRVFGRDLLICDPWHYLPVLERSQSALRNGAPFVAWDLPKPIQLVRDRILKHPKGDRAFVKLLMLAGKRGSMRSRWPVS